MAYTKIKPVKHHLQRCLDYTSNPKKTEKFSADDLNRLLSYTQNQNKTEHQLYVTGFRCNPAHCLPQNVPHKETLESTDG